MIVQSNVAQPQIIQRADPVDTFLARLTAGSQLAANALQGYAYFNTGRQAESSRLSEAMKFALTLNDAEGEAYLLSIGAPNSAIKQFRALKGQRLPEKAYYDINEARERARNAPDWDPVRFHGQINASQKGIPYKIEPSGSKGESVPQDVIPAPVGIPLDFFKQLQSPFSTAYRGPVQKTVASGGYYDPTMNDIEFITNLSSGPSLAERNPFA